MSMATQEGKMWLDGALVEQPDAKVHVLTHSLHYGLAVFEGCVRIRRQMGVQRFSVYKRIQSVY